MTEAAGEQSAALADDFAAVNAEAISFARSCTPDQWRTVVPGEDWMVGVVLHHIAEGHAQALHWLELMSHGEAVTDTGEDIDDRNSTHATRCTDVGVDETVALLEQNGARTEAALRRLSQAELDTTAPFGPAGGRPLPAGQLAEVTARHAREHLEHARAAVGESKD